MVIIGAICIAVLVSCLTSTFVDNTKAGQEIKKN